MRAALYPIPDRGPWAMLGSQTTREVAWLGGAR